MSALCKPNGSKIAPEDGSMVDASSLMKVATKSPEESDDILDNIGKLKLPSSSRGIFSGSITSKIAPISPRHPSSTTEDDTKEAEGSDSNANVNEAIEVIENFNALIEQWKKQITLTSEDSLFASIIKSITISVVFSVSGLGVVALILFPLLFWAPNTKEELMTSTKLLNLSFPINGTEMKSFCEFDEDFVTPGFTPFDPTGSYYITKVLQNLVMYVSTGFWYISLIGMIVSNHGHYRRRKDLIFSLMILPMIPVSWAVSHYDIMMYGGLPRFIAIASYGIFVMVNGVFLVYAGSYIRTEQDQRFTTSISGFIQLVSLLHHTRMKQPHLIDIM